MRACGTAGGSRDLAAGALDGRAGRVQVGMDLAPSAGRGGPAHAGIRVDPLPRRHGRRSARSAADHSADHQQVLRRRSGAGPQHDRVPGACGLQVFMSPGATRMPGTRLGLQHYRQAILDAMDATARITGRERRSSHGPAPAGSSVRWSPRTWPIRASSTGSRAYVHGHRPRPGQRAGLASAVIERAHRGTGRGRLQRPGYLDGRSLAEVFAWLRPNDLIWNYWVNNYLLGSSRLRSTSCSGTPTPPG